MHSLSLSLWRKRRGWLFEVCWKEWKLAKERIVEQIFRFVYKLPMARPRLTAASLASIFPLLHTRSNDPPPFAWLPLLPVSPPLSSPLIQTAWNHGNSTLRRSRHLRDREDYSGKRGEGKKSDVASGAWKIRDSHTTRSAGLINSTRIWPLWYEKIAKWILIDVFSRWRVDIKGRIALLFFLKEKLTKVRTRFFVSSFSSSSL